MLGALEDRVAVGTMNRGGLAGATWEIDDRFTAYDADHLLASNLDGGKMLLRIDPRDPATAPTLEGCARAVGALNDRRIMAMVEPIPTTRDAEGRVVWDDDPVRLIQAVGASAALGGSSAYTWLKIQATADIATVAAMTTQPLLLLGGAPGPDPSATYAAWEKALAEPTVRGLVVGRGAALPARRQRGRCRRRGGRARRAGGGDPTMIDHPWYVPAGSAADGTASVAIDPGRAGWTYCGLTVRTLRRGRLHVHHGRDRAGRAPTVRTGHR